MGKKKKARAARADRVVARTIHMHMVSNYRVKSAKGAIVRSGRALDTDLVETLASGAAVEVEAIRTSPAFFHVFG